MRIGRRASLTRTLIGLQLGLLLVMLAVVGVAQYLVLQHVLLAQSARTLAGELAVLSPILHHSLAHKTFSKLVPVLFQHFRRPGVEVLVSNAGGFLIANSASLPANVRPPVPAAGTYAVWSGRVVVAGALRQGGHFLGTLWLMASTASVSHILVEDTVLFSLLAVAVLIAVGWLGAVSVRRTLDPLARVIETTENIAAGRYGELANVHDAPRELARLGEAVNRMSAAVADAFSSQRQAQAEMRRFLADASHELRTPLAAVSGFLQLWEQDEGSPEERRQGLSAMQRETRRMTRLVNQLLTLSRLDAAPRQEIHPERVDVAGWVRDHEPTLRALGGDRIHLELSPAVSHVDPDRLMEVILNLVDNALRHTPPDGSITIGVAPEVDQVRVWVEDTGSGLTEEMLPHLFQRFYRGDAARSRDRGGMGLGLAIVKALVEAHGGTVEAHNAPGGGAIFTVHLPADV